MSESVRVVIADDQALVRAGFRAILETAGGVEVVAEAATGDEAVSAARRHQPDVVLLDIQMPRLDGLDAARQILAATSPPRVIMLTTFDLDEYLYESMRAGASGFLLKDTPREQLITAVRTVAAGDALLSSQVAHRLIERFVTSEPERRSSTRYLGGSLSHREADVWRAMARGLTNAEIAGELFVSESTVKTHVARVLSKLGVRDRLQAVIAAYETGLVRASQGRSPADGGAGLTS
jgi:DNA-binding NarL/FixJ family response regulator